MKHGTNTGKSLKTLKALCFTILLCGQLVGKNSNAVEDSPVTAESIESIDQIKKSNIGRAYGVISAGIGQNFYQGEDGKTLSAVAGFATGTPAGIFSSLVGYEFRVSRYFYLGLDVVGRWMFVSDSVSVGQAGAQQEFSLQDSQSLMFQVKPTFIFGDGKYGLYLSVGVGGHFALARNTITSTLTDLTDFAVSYGIGGYATIRPHIALNLNVFSFAPLAKNPTLNGTQLVLNSYGVEFGIRFFT